MKTTKDKVENCQAFLTVELEPDEMTSAMDAAYKHVAKHTDVPGFRKGKAPKNLVEQYAGRQRLLQEAIDHVLPQAYEQALTEHSIEPYGQPEIEVTQLEPLIFKATVPLTPAVELGEYNDIRLEPLKLEVTEDRIASVMEELRHQNATWEPVDRPLQYDDMAVMDIVGIVEEKPYVQKIGAQTQILKDSVSPAPGFAEQVIGLTKDETKDFTLKFPDDYLNEKVAGKEASFHVKLSEIKEEKLPELNDEFAGQVGKDFKTLDDLREEIVKSLTARAEETARIDIEERAINAAIEQAKVEYPPILVDYEISRILEEQERRLQSSGQGMEDYLKHMGKTVEQMRDDLRPIAGKNVVASLVLNKIADAEKVEVTEEDIQNGLNNMVKNVPEEQREAFLQMVDTPQTRQSLSLSLKTRKTIERLTDIAKTDDDKPKTVEITDETVENTVTAENAEENSENEVKEESND